MDFLANPIDFRVVVGNRVGRSGQLVGTAVVRARKSEV